MRDHVDPRMCDILQEGLLSCFKGDSVTNAMLRIRGQEGYERYDLLIDEQTVIGWDNLLRGKFSETMENRTKSLHGKKKAQQPFLIRKDAKKKSARINQEQEQEEKQNR
jgi:hypothetical protein